MKKAVVFILFGVLFLLGSSIGAKGQEREAEGPVLTGRVIDASTGTPLLGAFVHVLGESWGVITDSEGLFRLPGADRGTLLVAVEQLGYEDLVQEVEFAEEERVTLLAMAPDPILLEGIRVVMDRFERRRRSMATSIQLLDRKELVGAASFDLVDLIQAKSFLHPIHCSPGSVETLCAVVRGRIRPISVYVDEMPALGGLDFLSMIQPHELHMVEVYHSRGHVRVYTEGFMERVGRRPMALMPVGW